MIERIAPLAPADLPPRDRPFWQLTGPGAVLLGLAIGAGEIVIWPLITARYGASMTWAAVLGVFLQLWVNIEIGRWTIATGESSYTGFTRMWWSFAPLFILFNITSYLIPAWARTSGLALKALLLSPDHPSPDWFWTAVTFALVAALLFGPKRVYRAVERAVSVMIVVIVFGLLFIAFRVATPETIAEVGRGIANFGHIESGMPIRELFGALVFAGAGATGNLFYAFYLRDKRIGMGSRMPLLVNPFRQRDETVAREGFIFPETEANRRSFRDWLRFVTIDQTIFFWFLNTFTILLFILGAAAVLRPLGVVPQAGRLIWDEAVILADSIGPIGRPLFLIIGFATLFSTQVTVTDGLARSIADIFGTSFTFGKKTPIATWYARSAITVILFGVALTAFLEYGGITDLGFIFNAAYAGGFAMAVYTPLLLWMNLRHLPKSARPGLLNVAMMILASLVYVGFAVVSIIAEIRN